MKRLILVLIVVLLAALAGSLAWSGDEGAGDEGVMILQSREFGEHQRPPVRFDHYLHEQSIRCRSCHHDFFVFDDHNDGKGSKCSKCHKKAAVEEVPVSLNMAFHKRCKGCHQNYLEWEWDTGPITCGQCHVRGVKAQVAAPAKK